jgi:hypothetical protein
LPDNPPKADTVNILNLSGFAKPDRFGYKLKLDNSYIFSPERIVRLAVQAIRSGLKIILNA